MSACAMLALAAVPAQAQEADRCPAPVSANPAPPPRQPADAVYPTDFATGEGVLVAVIDTGVAAHPELTEVVPIADLVTPDTPNPHFDCDGHGTVVAGVIDSVAPHARIGSVRQTSSYVRKDENSLTSGSIASLAEAINKALDHHARVINISVVACLPASQASQVDKSALVDALARAERENAVVVAASGNATQDCTQDSVVLPTQEPTALSVSALGADPYTLASYALPVRGDKTALAAPGRIPFALSPRGDGWARGMSQGQGQVNPFEGTSFAAPVVSGTAALLIQRHPQASAREIRELIVASAQPPLGVVDPLAAVTQAPRHQEQARTVELAVPASPESSGVRTGQLIIAALALLSAASVLISAYVQAPRTRRRGSTSPSRRRTNWPRPRAQVWQS
ncbi:S8 family serine peptidase [Corynebacterium tapiri]|uniref:S8 family serine peptidase n=1 Tax=Corynebacterium tapiri TaxID=1448266 RepID=UPI001FEAE4D4|nr:S8 family serine peptidase [Corynebacterium tapiri]